MKDVLQSALVVPRVSHPPVRSHWDWLLFAFLLGLNILENLYGSEVFLWRPAALGLGVFPPFTLLWRRAYPLASVAIGYGTMILVLIFANAEEHAPWAGGGHFIVCLILNYALVRWGSGREAAVGLILILTINGLGEAVHWESTVNLIAGSAILLLPAAFGIIMRSRSDVHRQRIHEVRISERNQLARELHDTVAHHITAIAIQAQAARVSAGSQPEAALEALNVIERTASQTLTEMRKIVRALRDATDVDSVPQERLADIERLAGHSQSGPRIDVNLSGKLDVLAPSVETGLYRIAQEAITNARRHARNASRITVGVEGTEDEVCIIVADDGKGESLSSGALAGYGLIGLKERVTLLGGRFEAGPDPDGGWIVRAALPIKDGTL